MTTGPQFAAAPGPDPIDVVHTARLEGLRLCAEHARALHLMHADPVVMATLGGVIGEAEAMRRLRQQEEHWAREGFGLWALFDRASGEFVGRGGLRRVTILGRDEVEVAYAFRAAWWGRGLATELARFSVETGFGRLGLRSLVAFTLITNLPSQRVMQKVGFTRERDFTYADLPHVLYRIARPDSAE